MELIGLKLALRDFCQQVSKQHQIRIQFSVDNELPNPASEVSLCFYRVAQEAVQNSVKHSGSDCIEVGLAFSHGMLTMTIKDYGSGFDSSSLKNGLGLATMRERLRLVEGTLIVDSKPGNGTEVRAQVPMSASARQSA